MGRPTRVTNDIRRLRFAHGEMTQAELAQRIGVTRQTIIAIEQGRYSPSLEMAFQIAGAFGVPLDDVFQYPANGPNLVTMAMNGWGEPEPAWWLNLQAHPDTTVELHDRTLAVRGRAATPEERPHLWEMWRGYDGDQLDAWAARRPRETAVVILEPR
jgi:DNA-binding XRE family transcriptional regulator